MIGQWMYTMAKKTKKEAKIKNDKKESPVDFIAVKDETNEEYNVKSIEAESETKLEDDPGEGEAVTLRFFDFAANPEAFKDRMPTANELFTSHLKQIEIELWKDEWRPIYEIQPRLMFAKDKSHYRIVIAARPAKGSLLSFKDKPQTLKELAHGQRPKNSN